MMPMVMSFLITSPTFWPITSENSLIVQPSWILTIFLRGLVISATSVCGAYLSSFLCGFLPEGSVLRSGSFLNDGFSRNSRSSFGPYSVFFCHFFFDGLAGIRDGGTCDGSSTGAPNVGLPNCLAGRGPAPTGLCGTC